MLLLGLAGCSSLPDMSSVTAVFQPDPGRTVSGQPLPLPGVAGGPAIATAAAGDPVAAFAASARPGQLGSVGGESARLARAFNAASGRECREVILGTGLSERSHIACRQPDGSFASARPLLLGGAPR